MTSTEKPTLKDRLITGILKGASFAGIMGIFDEISGAGFELITFTFYFLAAGALFGFINPISNFNPRDLFESKSDYKRLLILVVVCQVAGLAAYFSMETPALGLLKTVALLFLMSLLLFVGSHGLPISSSK